MRVGICVNILYSFSYEGSLKGSSSSGDSVAQAKFRRWRCKLPLDPSLIYVAFYSIQMLEAACLAIVLLPLVGCRPLNTAPERIESPALVARWLAHSVDWGTISTTSVHLGGAAFGNVASLSDGPPGCSTGRLLFYLTSMDATAQDLEANSTASLTICEAQLPGGCTGIDPEDPTCAKLSVSGRLERVPPEALPLAEDLLFSRHPAMRSWPADHGFHVYELHPVTLRLLDHYGGAKDLTPEEYFAAGACLDGAPSARCRGAERLKRSNRPLQASA